MPRTLPRLSVMLASLGAGCSCQGRLRHADAFERATEPGRGLGRARSRGSARSTPGACQALADWLCPVRRQLDKGVANDPGSVSVGRLCCDCGLALAECPDGDLVD